MCQLVGQRKDPATDGIGRIEENNREEVVEDRDPAHLLNFDA
jgi:hypothetical protein